MTDEEKAEEWCKNNCGVWVNDCNFACNGKQGVLYGLAEGRKEQEKSDKGFCESFCMKGGRIAELEKENKISEEIIIGEQQEINRLEKENAELKDFCTKLIKTNNELRESLRKYEIVPDVDYLPNGVEVYIENVGNNPYGVK